jgi:hypothetical protein
MFLGGWMDGWMEVKAVQSIAYSNQKLYFDFLRLIRYCSYYFQGFSKNV